MTYPMEFQEYVEDAQRRIKEVNVNNGWYLESRPFSADIALLHSEVSEMYEAYRDWGLKDMTKEDPSDQNIRQKPEGVGSEAADIFIRLLDTCDRFNINLIQEFSRKLAFNATRGYKHGGKLE
jgi:hypothetical protein